MRYPVFILLTACFFSCKGPANTTTAANDSTSQTNTKPAATDHCPVSAEAAANIAHALSLQVLEDMTDEEARNWKPSDDMTQGLTSQQFDTVYNDHCLLCIKRTADYMGAYPTTAITYHNFDKRTGKEITAKDVFTKAKMNELLTECNNDIALTIENARKDVLPADREDYYNAMQTRPQFTMESLDKFMIADDGVTFNYDFEFPHARLDLEPTGDISFSIQDIRPFLKPDGPLGFWLK